MHRKKRKYTESPLPWFSYLGGYPAPIEVAGLSKHPRWRHLHKQRQNALYFEPRAADLDHHDIKSRKGETAAAAVGSSSAICLLRSVESTGGGKQEEGLHHDNTWKVWTATKTKSIQVEQKGGGGGSNAERRCLFLPSAAQVKGRINPLYPGLWPSNQMRSSCSRAGILSLLSWLACYFPRCI